MKQVILLKRVFGRTITCPLRDMSKLIVHIVNYLENYFYSQLLPIAVAQIGCNIYVYEREEWKMDIR